MKPYNICEYKTINYQDKKSNVVVMILLIIGILVLICSYKIKIYNKYVLVKENNNYIISINALNLDDFSKNNTIFIKGKKYKYNIISKEYDTFDNSIYAILHIDIKKYQSVSDYTYIYLEKSNKTVLETLTNFFVGGNYD